VAGELRLALLRWYDGQARDLPWRRTRDPYAIWVSEVMLQQTQVSVVLPYWRTFLARFPDVAALARSDLDEVLAAWRGLGYYARARNLHRAAQAVVERHAGRLPDDVEALRALPGFGRYTVGAVASIAFGRSVPLVDGNVARVLARLFGVEGSAGDAVREKQLWALAETLVEGERPGDWNQALMELGATVCRPEQPTCLLCPLRSCCVALASGRVGGIPPGSELPALRARWPQIAARPLGRVERTLTHRALSIEIFAVEHLPPPAGARWVTVEGARTLGISAAMQAVLGRVLEAPSSPGDDPWKSLRSPRSRR